MALKHTSRLMLVLAVAVSGYAVTPPAPAGASQLQLHELLFNRAKRQQVRQNRATRNPRQAQPQQAAAPRRAAPRRVVRVTGPSYYNYAAPAISTVALASLLPDVNPTGSVAEGAEGLETTEVAVVAPPQARNRFVNALDHVPGVDIALEPAIAEVVRAHYAENPDFVWVDSLRVNPEGLAVAAMLNDAASHGLNGAHYAVDVPSDNWRRDRIDERYGELLAFEMTLTARAIRYAMDIKDGAVDPNKLSGYHDFNKNRLTPAAALFGLTGTDDAIAWLERLAPRQAQYAALRDELVRLDTLVEEPIILPEGLMMRPGADEPALPLIIRAVERRISDETRVKHAEALDTYEGGTLYEGGLVELIRDAQRELSLVPDGIVGPKTAARLADVSIENRKAMVRMALERLRWHPEDFGDRHVVINQPEYRVRYVAGGETALSMRAIVGKPSNQTYFFHDEIDHVVYDPYWGVPQSIIVNTYLPKLWRDPSYLDRNGFIVTTHSGRQVSSRSINWHQYNGKVPFNVRQKPGPRNALGELKIMFPNRHSIYMHDTPARDLFARSSRAYSAGCVRLEDPRAMAAAVLGKDVSHVTAQLGGYEQVERLETKVPVFVSYFTAWPNDEGEIAYHPDMYERDAYLGKALDATTKARTDIGTI